MDFSVTERQIIATAQSRLVHLKWLRLVSCIAMLAVITAMLLGQLDPALAALTLFGLAMFCAAAPQLGGKPRFEDLTALLTAKLESSDAA